MSKQEFPIKKKKRLKCLGADRLEGGVGDEEYLLAALLQPLEQGHQLRVPEVEEGGDGGGDGDGS